MVSALLHSQVLLDESESHLLEHAAKGEAPTDMSPTVVIRVSQRLYRKVLRLGRRAGEIGYEELNTVTDMLEYVMIQVAPVAKMGTTGIGALTGLGNPEEEDMVCPSCSNPITGVYEPGDYTCSGCSAQVRVNPGKENPGKKNPAKKALERGDPGVRALHFRLKKDAYYLGKALRERYGVKRTKVVWLDSPDRGWFLLWEESPMTKGGLPWWSTGRAVGADRKSNPDAPEGYWDYAPLEVGAGDVGHPDRPVEGTQSYFDDDEWMDMVGPDTGSSNGHIADPFTPRRHFGMFTFKGNRAVELFAQRWRDRFLAEESGDTLFATGEFLTELEQLASLPGLSEASDTDVEERIISYILEGDKVVEMDGETYHYPHMVTPDYYSEPADEY